MPIAKITTVLVVPWLLLGLSQSCPSLYASSQHGSCTRVKLTAFRETHCWVDELGRANDADAI
jgi:hypothetical protein